MLKESRSQRPNQERLALGGKLAAGLCFFFFLAALARLFFRVEGCVEFEMQSQVFLGQVVYTVVQEH